MDDARSAAASYHKVMLPSAPGFESVEVWSADLATIGVNIDEALALLDADERARAASFRFDLHKGRFIRRRWLRRRILADRFGVDPREFRFSTEPLGRERPSYPASLRGIGFSTSHADGRALVAICAGGDVGVDIARLDPTFSDAEARVFMSAAEHASWSVLRGDASLAAFFRLWTRKEACLKCAGTGLARDPTTVEAWDANVTARGEARWPAEAWCTLVLDLGPGWAGAVAVGAPPRE